MDFFRNGIKTVLGTSETDQQPSPAETVEKLVDRVLSSTLLDDRRDACRALKALSRKYRIEVGAQSIPALVQVLKSDGQDGEIISYAVDTLCNVVASEEFDEEADNAAVSVNIGYQFTEMFIKKPEHISMLMNCLEMYDFRVRHSVIQLITTLIANKTREMQELILISPMSISKLMDLLRDNREVIRNSVLLLLIQLTKGNSNIQKIVAFENAFDRLFDIIGNEDFSDGGIVVEDCLVLLLNLLKNNSSNQLFFKEGSYIQRLALLFKLLPVEKEWAPQKVSNFHCMLQVIRSLVAPCNQQQVVSSCQRTMRNCQILDVLCDMLMSTSVPADILTEIINTVAEVARGDNENQNRLSNIIAPSNPSRPIIVVLLMSMITEKQLLSLRCAALYCFQCYLHRNSTIQKKVVQTLLPSGDADVNSLSTGQLLCTGLFSTDSLANWFSAVALMHTLINNDDQKEELLRVLLATPGGVHPTTLLEQCINLMQQENSQIQSKVGLLMLLSVWLAHCPNAVHSLLKTRDTVAYLTAQIISNEHGECEYLMQGMCAFLMGICIQYNNNFVPNQRREDISNVIIKRINKETFCNKLSEISRHEAYSRACKQPQVRSRAANDLLLDYEYCKLYKDLEVIILRLVNGFDINVIELTELNLGSEASAIISKYKSIIRSMDAQNQKLQQTLKTVEEENAELIQQLLHTQAINTQLSDQNMLLKAQFMAIQDVDKIEIPVISEETLNTNVYYNEILRLAKELKALQQQVYSEKQRANSVNDELRKLQNDQEDLLELLNDQEAKIMRYERQIKATGQSINTACIGDSNTK